MMQANKKPDISSAEFVISSPDMKGCPETQMPEYAFIGRSNVGKSSLINMLTQSKGLAKISQTPGKTRLINHFLINEEWYLVDLPGYGYAKISQKERAKWKKMINDYLLKRENLVCTFILVDSRHEPQKIDTEFMGWLSTQELPFVIVFTKTDKLSKRQLEDSMTRYRNMLKESWEEMPPSYITSAKTSLGKEEILKFIWENNKLYHEYIQSIS
jgi:GTP-binding protein